MRIAIIMIGWLTMFYALNANSQAREGVRYEKGFKMEDGVYLSADQYRGNNPIKMDRLKAPIDKNDPDFIRKLTKLPSFEMLSAAGNWVQIDTRQIFGYSINGNPFIRFDKGYYKIVVVGEISYFAVPIANPAASGPRFGVGIGTYGAGVGVSVPIGGNSSKANTKEIILDTSTGKLADLMPETLAEFMKDDLDTSNKYNALKKRKRKKVMHEYIKFYNDANPLYFPE